MASNDQLVDAIRTAVDAAVSLRQLALQRIERFPAADADCGTATGIPPLNAKGRLFQTSQNATT
jgi:hypothetical protein